jgi:hypothetical protein
MMKDAITSDDTLTGTGKGGRLNPEQAKKFISYMTDKTALLKDTRLEQMNAPEKQLDFLLIGSRLIRKATEATSPSELAAANTSRKELRSVKVRLAADITAEFDEDNIEGQAGSERIARELAQQFGNDLADLMLNGDTAATGADASFLTIGDGIIKQAKTSTDTHKFKLTGTDYKGTVFPGMLKLMPNKFKNDRTNMRIYCSSSVADTYILSVTDRATALGDDTLKTGLFNKFLGIKVFPVEYMPDDVIILTHRLNLVSGVQRAMKVYSQFNQRKDLTEYTMYMRLDPGKIVWDDALVIAYPF